MLSGVATATAASFAVAWLLLKVGKQTDGNGLQAAVDKTAELKGAKVNDALGTLTASAVKTIVFACDAGMGSSAMGASILRKKVKAAGLGVSVTNTSVSDLPADASIVVTHRSLNEQARRKAPAAHHISIDDFIKSPEYDTLVERLKS